MSVNFRYPNITGNSEREQIAQIKSYLHQLVDQLNYSMSQMEKSLHESSNAEQNGTDLPNYKVDT